VEAKHYARELKYPKGSLVHNGTNEDDFQYCLPDNKEISVCRVLGPCFVAEGLIERSDPRMKLFV
jgi:hypothetical protein